MERGAAMRLVHGLRFDNLRGDISGGLTAGVVAFPLALAFGVASGAGPMAGLYGAIFVGFFAALFGGTPSQVSGPTGPMTVVMAVVVTRFADDPALAFTVVVIAGLLQILFGALRLGGYVTLVPMTIVSGFMSGIGCIIIILQIAPILGQPIPGGGTVGVLKALPEIVRGVRWDAALVGALALAVVLFTPKRIGRVAPPPLIAVVFGTLLVHFGLPSVPVLGDIPTGFPDPQTPRLSWNALPDMVSSALVLALVGSVDSLLVSLIADNITRTHHDSNRELIGQGIGNALAGLFGGLPGTGATMRTVVNLRSGGRTPISGMLHALFLLAVVLGLGPLAGRIPHAVLAGVLIKVGVDIIDWNFLKRVPTAPRPTVALMGTTLLLTVFVDLIVAVATGTIAASLLFVKRMSELQLESIRAHDGVAGEIPLSEAEQAVLSRHPRDILLYHMSGPMSFGAAQGMARRVTAQGGCKVLVIDLTDVPFVDASASLAIEDIVHRARDQGVHALLAGVHPNVEKILTRIGVMKTIPAEARAGSRIEALRRAAALCGDGAAKASARSQA
jgi:SulP family sulfate permease